MDYECNTCPSKKWYYICLVIVVLQIIFIAVIVIANNKHAIGWLLLAGFYSVFSIVFLMSAQQVYRYLKIKRIKTVPVVEIA
jgi:hypothetical protein